MDHHYDMVFEARNDARPTGLGRDTRRVGLIASVGARQTHTRLSQYAFRTCGPDVGQFRGGNDRLRVRVKSRKHDTQNLLQLLSATARVFGRVCVHGFKQIDESCQKRIGNRRFTGMSTQELAITKHPPDEFNLMGGEFIIIK